MRLRYFGAHPHLSEREVVDVVEKGGPDHLALAAERAGQFLGIAQYDRIAGSVVAEVAFVVDDAHQGLGIGTLLLEYLASEGEDGGVRLGLVGHDAVVAAYNALSDNFGGEMTGGVLQPMVPAGGVETILGGIQDPSFGPLVVFGLGGITVEVLGDHITRLAPLTDADAREMVTGLRGSALLTGYRGQQAVDVDGLVQALHRVSRLVEELPEVAELDCNPVIATPDGPLVVDARMRIDPCAAHLMDDTRHLR